VRAENAKPPVEEEKKVKVVFDVVVKVD